MDKKRLTKLQGLIEQIEASDNATCGLKRAARSFLKEIVLFENHISGLNRLKREKLPAKVLKVQIGGGTHILPGFLNIDIIPPADVIYDVREGIPLRSDSVE